MLLSNAMDKVLNATFKFLLLGRRGCDFGHADGAFLEQPARGAAALLASYTLRSSRRWEMDDSHPSDF